MAASDGKHSSTTFCINVGVQLVNNHPPVVDATASGMVRIESSLDFLLVFVNCNCRVIPVL